MAIKRSALLGVPPTLDATYFRNIPYQFLQPAVNFDTVPATGPAWVISHRPLLLQDMIYATITWNAGVPSLSGWTNLSTPAFAHLQPIRTKGAIHSPGDPSGQMSAVKLLNAGESVYDAEEGVPWGDYTHTTLDPINTLAMWTIQQYARRPAVEWRTSISEISPVKP